MFFFFFFLELNIQKNLFTFAILSQYNSSAQYLDCIFCIEDFHPITYFCFSEDSFVILKQSAQCALELWHL